MERVPRFKAVPANSCRTSQPPLFLLRSFASLRPLLDGGDDLFTNWVLAIRCFKVLTPWTVYYCGAGGAASRQGLVTVLTPNCSTLLEFKKGSQAYNASLGFLRTVPERRIFCSDSLRTAPFPCLSLLDLRRTATTTTTTTPQRTTEIGQGEGNGW